MSVLNDTKCSLCGVVDLSLIHPCHCRQFGSVDAHHKGSCCCIVNVVDAGTTRILTVSGVRSYTECEAQVFIKTER